MSGPTTPTGPQPTVEALSRLLKAEAARLGFAACGITTAEPFPEAEAVMLARIADGHLAGIAWFTPDWAHLACTPAELLPGARSLVVLAAPYHTQAPSPPDGPPRGRIARYAWGDDYHVTVKARLRDLVAFLERATGRKPAHRLFVDSSPLAERAAAERAGIGWFGKNTMILLPGIGSYVFLAAVLLDVELAPDEPVRKSCGSCDRCIRACPTDALVGPGVLDASRCISYLTIEHRGAVAEELRPLMGDYVFGCDICQEVCPVNRKGGPIGWPAFQPRDGVGAMPRLSDLLTMSVEDYQRTLRGSPVKRAKLRGLKRNAAIAAGNSGDPAAVPALVAALDDGEPLVRQHAAWALGEIGGADALAALTAALAGETDPDVEREIRAAISGLPSSSSGPVLHQQA